MKKIKINKRSLTFFSLFVLGIFHWYLFMNLGQPTFKFFDWTFANQFHNVFKQSVQELKIPYHATMFNMPNADNKIPVEKIRWLAHGSQLASPHLILLSFFKVSTMMTLNIIFYFSIGFWGILLWIKKFNLSIPASIFLFIIWSFNGFIVSRIGDTLLTTPAIKSIASHYGDAEITVLGHPKRYKVLQYLPFVYCTGSISKNSRSYFFQDRKQIIVSNDFTFKTKRIH